MVLIDIIDFRKFNHPPYNQMSGDGILRAFALFLLEQTKYRETVGRYGGDEFILLMEGSASEVAAGILSRQRRLQSQGGLVVSISCQSPPADASAVTVPVAFRAAIKQCCATAGNSAENTHFIVALEHVAELLSQVRADGGPGPRIADYGTFDARRYISYWLNNVSVT